MSKRRDLVRAIPDAATHGTWTTVPTLEELQMSCTCDPWIEGLCEECAAQAAEDDGDPWMRG